MNRLYFGDNLKWLSAENSGDAATKGNKLARVSWNNGLYVRDEQLSTSLKNRIEARDFSPIVSGRGSAQGVKTRRRSFLPRCALAVVDNSYWQPGSLKLPMRVCEPPGLDSWPARVGLSSRLQLNLEIALSGVPAKIQSAFQ
jgi:hypothetical protein